MSTLSVCTSFPNKLGKWLGKFTTMEQRQRPQNYWVKLTEEKSHPQLHPTPKLVSTEGKTVTGAEHHAAQQVLPWGLAPLPHAGGQAKGQQGTRNSLQALVGNQPYVLWGWRWSQTAWRRQIWGFSAGGHTTSSGGLPTVEPSFSSSW